MTMVTTKEDVKVCIAWLKENNMRINEKLYQRSKEHLELQNF